VRAASLPLSPSPSGRIAITGSSGLIGGALRAAFTAKGYSVTELDLRAEDGARGDVRDPARVEALLSNCDGVVHLAAVSRVVWGERDPESCWSTNVEGLRNVLSVARSKPQPPWVVFASSREIYGQPESLPVDEDCPPRPINVYGRSKVEGELLVEQAARTGLRAATLRLSNVFGSASDYADRVVPAFVRAATEGRPLRVDGIEHTFDFTHVDDVAEGFVALVQKLFAGDPAPPPIQLVSGRGTTLGELAALTIRIAGSASRIETAPERDFDVSRFVGRPERAASILGWAPHVTLEEGLERMVDALRCAY
jgi:UDP-glucose 4-epimerase